MQIALDERDGRALHGDVGAGAHGDADLGLRERRRIVDAVAGHRDKAALVLKRLHRRHFLIRHHLGDHVVDPELARDRKGRRAAVAGQHHRLDPLAAECLEGGDGALLDRIGDGNQPSRLCFNGDQHHALTLLAQRVGAGRKIARLNTKRSEKRHYRPPRDRRRPNLSPLCRARCRNPLPARF